MLPVLCEFNFLTMDYPSAVSRGPHQAIPGLPAWLVRNWVKSHLPVYKTKS